MNQRGRGRESFPPTRFDRGKHASRKRLPTPSAKRLQNGITAKQPPSTNRQGAGLRVRFRRPDYFQKISIRKRFPNQLVSLRRPKTGIPSQNGPERRRASDRLELVSNRNSLEIRTASPKLPPHETYASASQRNTCTKMKHQKTTGESRIHPIESSARPSRFVARQSRLPSLSAPFNCFPAFQAFASSCSTPATCATKIRCRYSF